MMRMLKPLSVLVAAALALAIPASHAGAPSDAKTFAPTGEYQHLWLTFEGGEQPIKAFVGLRNGESTTVWFLHGAVPGGVKASGSYQLLLDRHKLALTNSELKGTIDLRQVSIWAPMALFAEAKISIDAKRTGDKIAGTWSTTLADGKSAKGSLTGTLTDESTLRSQQAFDTKSSTWPSYHGPFGTNKGVPSKSPLVDSLTDAKPVWRSEQRLGSGWGTGVDSRYKHRAAVGMVCGGSSSPIVAGDRIYLFHYEPAGEPDAKLLDEAVAAFKANFKRDPSATELEELKSYSRPQADTIITCMDAKTGAILWRVTFPAMSGNYQTHKWRGFNPTATLMGPVLIANDYAGNWVGLNADKGNVLWTLRNSNKVTGDQAALGAVAAGKLPILPSPKDQSMAIDPETGKVVWSKPGGPQAHVWGKAGDERVLFLGYKKAVCYDVATGKQLWTIEEPLEFEAASTALIAGDMLVAHVKAADKKQGGHFQGWKLTDAGATKVWQDDFLPLDENLSVSINDGKAYCVGRHIIRCLDVATGKKIAERVFEPDVKDPKTYGIGSNQWLGIVGDRLFLSPEGQHGRQSIAMLDANTLKDIGNRFVPPNNSTTAYGRMSIAFPVVDGRLIVRGVDGLYLYDIRK